MLESHDLRVYVCPPSPFGQRTWSSEGEERQVPSSFTTSITVGERQRHPSFSLRSVRFRNVPRKINRYSASAMLFALLSFIWPLVMESGVRDTQAGYIAQQL